MENCRPLRLAQQAMVYGSTNDMGSSNSLAGMGVCKMTALLIIVVAVLAFVIGRAAEGAKRDSGKHSAFTLDTAQKQGYLRGRISIDPDKMLTMDEMLLALHRQEGLLNAVNDNFGDLHRMAKKYGAER